MVGTQIYISNQRVDLKEGIDIPLTYSIADIREPSKRKQSFSKTIVLPSSKTNDKVFTHAFEINRDGGYNVNKKTEAKILQDGLTQFTGSVQLKSITQNDYGAYEYHVVVFGELIDLFHEIGKKKLTELDFSRFNHDYTLATQRKSWETEIRENNIWIPFQFGNGYVYPLIDYGHDILSESFDVSHLYPSLYLKTIIDQIFSEAGFSYSSAFFDSALFKSLIVPFSRNRLELSTQQIKERLFEAENTSKQELLLSSPSSAGAIQAQVDFDNELNDLGGNYDHLVSTFTVPDTGYYDFATTIYTGIRLRVDTPGVSVVPTASSPLNVIIEIRRNGVPINSYVQSINLSNVPVFTSSYESNNIMANPDPNGIFSSVQFPNESNRVLVTVNNQKFDQGDTISVHLRLNYNYTINWSSGGSGVFADKFKDAATGTVYYSGNYYAQVKSQRRFYNRINNVTVLEGGEVDMNNVLPDKIEQRDLLSSVIKMFNLYLEQDKLNPKNYLIEPRDDFYSSGIVRDWSKKLDYDSEMTLLPMGALDAGKYLYTYKKDKDHYNSQYEDKWGEVYGEHQIDVENDFIKTEHKTELIFSPTPVSDDGITTRVIPRIFSNTSSGVQPASPNIRILIYGGMKPAIGGQWHHTSSINSTISGFDYPYSGHLDDPFNPSVDINFGIVKEVYYSSLIQPIIWTNNNLYNAYYKKFIEEITDAESVLFKGSFYLHPKDIAELDFRDQFYFKNAYWRLNKIEDKDPGVSLSLCEFIKLKQADVFVPSTGELIGGAGDIDEYVPPKQHAQVLSSGNNYSLKSSHVVSGKKNMIAHDSNDVWVNGSNNLVHSTASGIMILGDGNTIESGVKNVTLINTHNRTITTSGEFWLNGVKVESLTEERR